MSYGNLTKHDTVHALWYEHDEMKFFENECFMDYWFTKCMMTITHRVMTSEILSLLASTLYDPDISCGTHGFHISLW